MERRDPWQGLGEAVAQTGSDVIGLWLRARARKAQAQAQRLAEQQARENERKAKDQRRKWLEHVRKQMARGEAGDASQEDARAALRGRGGRPNPLDDQFF
jgi:hypothetical protein